MSYKLGDIICFKRLMYTHYGVYIGNNNIIHKDRKFRNGSNARISNINDVNGIPYIKPDPIYIKSLKLEAYDTYTRHTVVERAYSMLDDKYYNMFTDNCEHFVTLIKYNKKASTQATKLKKIIWLIVVILCTQFIIYLK